MDPDEQLRILCENAVEVVPKDALEQKLRSGRRLRVKLGMDPTSSDVHIGSAVPLRKLRKFQDLGHVAVLIVGDFTAQIGDPSELDKTRPMLSKQQVEEFAARNLEQYRLILSDERLEVRYNSEWLEALGVRGMLELASVETVAQLLKRDDFAQRYESGAPLTVREFLYPLLQGYDSVAVEADVELGGTDQHFNLMVGRHIQRAYGQEPQVVMTTPLLEGTDGVKKASQSLGNYVGITEEPNEIFGKLMRVPDALIGKYLRLATDLRADVIEEFERTLSPRDLKRLLATEVVTIYHGGAAAEAAVAHFDRVFVDHDEPEEVPEAPIPASCIEDGEVFVPKLLKQIGLASSVSVARRLIEQGGVRVDGDRLNDERVPASKLRGRVLKVGKRRFARLL